MLYKPPLLTETHCILFHPSLHEHVVICCWREPTPTHYQVMASVQATDYHITTLLITLVVRDVKCSKRCGTMVHTVCLQYHVCGVYLTQFKLYFKKDYRVVLFPPQYIRDKSHRLINVRVPQVMKQKILQCI